MELKTRSTSLAFAVGSIKICTCARFPHVLGPQGVQVVTCINGQCFPQSSKSQVEEFYSEVVPLCSSVLFSLFYQCDQCRFTPSAWGLMAGLL